MNQKIEENTKYYLIQLECYFLDLLDNSKKYNKQEANIILNEANKYYDKLAEMVCKKYGIN